MLYYNSICVERQLISPPFTVFRRADGALRRSNRFISPILDIPSGRYLSPAGETGPGRIRASFVAVPIFVREPSVAPDIVSSGELLHIFVKQKEYFYLWQKN